MLFFFHSPCMATKMVAAWSTVMVFVLKRFDYIHTGYHMAKKLSIYLLRGIFLLDKLSKMILNYYIQIYLQHQQGDHQQNHTKHRSFAVVIRVILLGHLPTTFPTEPAAAETEANNRH